MTVPYLAQIKSEYNSLYIISNHYLSFYHKVHDKMCISGTWHIKMTNAILQWGKNTLEIVQWRNEYWPKEFKRKCSCDNGLQLLFFFFFYWMLCQSPDTQFMPKRFYFEDSAVKTWGIIKTWNLYFCNCSQITFSPVWNSHSKDMGICIWSHARRKAAVF